MSDSHKQGDNNQSEDLSHPGERGRQLGHENAHGGQCVGTGGHGTTAGASSDQPVGGYHVLDSSKLSQQQLHPGMNPDPVERGRELGHENAHGGQCVGTGGHCAIKDGRCSVKDAQCLVKEGHCVGKDGRCAGARWR